MRNSKVLAAALISTSLVGAAPALAQEGKGFGRDGQFILSADRLFGLSFTSIKTEAGDGSSTDTDSRTTISLLWPGGPTPYQVPHVAFDFVVASGFTVGGSVGFTSGSGTTKSEITNGPSSEHDSPTTTVLEFAPRVGFALPLSDQFAFWPRAGVTYYSVKSESTSVAGLPQTTFKISQNGFGLDIEPMFVFSPVSHFGIIAGPILDFPLSGTQSTEITPNPAGVTQPDGKLKYTNYGITLGILGYFGG